VNLFVGPNNTGKTSILEAIQLLVGQNDIEELLRVVCRRGKINGSPPARWLCEQIPAESRISGRFDTIPNNEASVVIRNEINGDDLEDKTFYVASIEVDSAYAGHQQGVVTHLFDKRERITRGGAVQVLCPAVFSSPFLQQDSDVLAELYDSSVKSKSKDEVIAFIRESLDPGFSDVDSIASSEAKSFTRFQVTHQDFKSSVDLTQFGEGVQRVFQIGLLFAYARGGVVLIDEFENAIHHALLSPLAGLIHRLAEKFDTQVFLTTHSKECVDAFSSDTIHVADFSAYSLRQEQGEVRCYVYPGERLHRLIAELNIDLRGTSSKP
jgi:predicted ATPase